MTRDITSLHNLADALSDSVLAASPETLLAEAAQDRDDADRAFDRVASRAVRQARWRRIARHARGFASSLALGASWRPAMAAIAGIAVVLVAGDLYLHQPAYAPASAPRVSAVEAPAKRAVDDSTVRPPAMSYENATAGGVVGVPGREEGAAPHVATLPPSVKADRLDEPRRVRTLGIRPDATERAAETPAGQARSPTQAKRQPFDGVATETETQPASVLAAPPSSRLAIAPVTAAVQNGVAEDRDHALYFDWPLRGNVIAPFGSAAGSTLNNGIDIAAPVGTDIRAAEEGVVIFAGSREGFGNLVLLRHRDDFVTAYANASRLLVKVNDRVRRGQVIAKSGRAGTAGTPQLHFEIRKGDAPLDPTRYLRAG